jgi:hypothetical protein
MEAFTETIRFLGFDDDQERVRRAVAFSSFETLRDQELKRGFREKPSGEGSFFRSGRAGGWRGMLTEQQAERLIRDHGGVMRRLGYLPEAG